MTQTAIFEYCSVKVKFVRHLYRQSKHAWFQETLLFSVDFTFLPTHYLISVNVIHILEFQQLPLLVFNPVHSVPSLKKSTILPVHFPNGAPYDAKPMGSNHRRIRLFASLLYTKLLKNLKNLKTIGIDPI